MEQTLPSGLDLLYIFLNERIFSLRCFGKAAARGLWDGGSGLHQSVALELQETSFVFFQLINSVQFLHLLPPFCQCKICGRNSLWRDLPCIGKLLWCTARGHPPTDTHKYPLFPQGAGRAFSGLSAAAIPAAPCPAFTGCGRWQLVDPCPVGVLGIMELLP